MKIFTWHIHGSYLFYLSQGNYEIYIPVKDEKTEGYYGRGETFPFGDNVIEIPAADVKNHGFDCILFQTNQNYLVDQFEVLSEEQRKLPKIYLEHDPPRQHPTDTRHLINDPDIVLVHVTHFNNLMWDSNNTPARVIEHGVTDPGDLYKGTLRKGLVVINNLPVRGRLLGFDIFQQVKEQVPVDLVGMGTGDWGLGEVLHPQLPQFQSNYRFFFNPIRYTSLGLAVCEAMMMGMPVVGLATTELSSVIDNGYSGFIHTDVNYLIDKMNLLLDDPLLAKEIGANGRQVAAKRFNITRFTYEWEELFREVMKREARKKFHIVH
ncbi:MAG: glycosyltransferase family 4 protein [Bacteroidetes bacterium]|nr:glycosyltransferase family 4 protein [Bacteroidota bacterium]